VTNLQNTLRPKQEKTNKDACLPLSRQPEAVVGAALLALSGVEAGAAGIGADPKLKLEPKPIAVMFVVLDLPNFRRKGTLFLGSFLIFFLESRRRPCSRRAPMSDSKDGRTTIRANICPNPIPLLSSALLYTINSSLDTIK